MATPTIALRFRDTTPDVDTIAAHRQVLGQEGAVWWGWWKKDFEETNATAVKSRMGGLRAGSVLLVNRAKQQSFLADFTAFSDNESVDPARVPGYYREYIREIAGFFLLTAIEDHSYDPSLAERFGEQTILWTLEDQPTRYLHARTADARNRSCILHLSDLHFGADYGFKVQGELLPLGDNRCTLTESLVQDLERLRVNDDVAAILVSGDFMSKGDWNDQARDAALQEFATLRNALGLQKDQIVALPGNHDIVRYPEGRQINVEKIAVEKQTNYQHEREFRTFVDELIDRNWRDSLNYTRRIRLNAVDLLLCVVNSCTITATQWTEYGFVGPNGLDAVRALCKEPVNRPTFRLLALHHHLLPVADVEAPQSHGVTLALDASEILAQAQKSGAHIILHGHQHKPKIALYQDIALNGFPQGLPIYVIANGSAGAKNSRLPAGERNTYCLFRLNADGAELWMRELRLDGVRGAELFHGKLASSPALPV